MKIVYKSAFITEELNPDVVLRTVPSKACIEIHKEKNESGYDLLYNGTIIDPETTEIECNGDCELVVRKDSERHVFSVKSVAQPLPLKYAKAYEQFRYEYQEKELDEIRSIQKGLLRLYAVDQSTDVYDWSDTFKQIEASFSAFKIICEKPKSHLKAVNEVRPIETVKRIGYESIPYLAAHSEDWLARTASGLKPARLFSRVEDDEFQIYENRVVKTLTDLILGFLRRTEKQLRDQRDQLRGIMNSSVQTGSFGFDISFQKAVSELMSSDKKGDEYRSKSLELVEKLQDWSYRLLKKYRSLRQTRLYRYLKKSKPVQNPLNETNILVMDKHYSVIFNVMQLVSILDKVDPEVAKSLIAQMPEVLKSVVENEKAYAGVLTKGIESCDMSTSACYQTEDEIVKALQKEIDKDETTFEQKQYYFEKMAEAAKRKENKDSEHKKIVLTILKYGGEALMIGLVITAGIFIGKADINFSPRMKT